jgi:hypothetical protein
MSPSLNRMMPGGCIYGEAGKMVMSVGSIVGRDSVAVALGVGKDVGVGVDEGSLVRVGEGMGVGVWVRVGKGVLLGMEVEVRVLVGGGRKGVLEGVGVVLMVGVGVIVGVTLVVPVVVVVGLRLGVSEPVGEGGVLVKMDVWVAKITGVMEAVMVGVPAFLPPLPGASNAATAPAK